MLHLGHNNVWDRRIDESHSNSTLTCREVFERVQAIDPGIGRVEDDPWFEAYRARHGRLVRKTGLDPGWWTPRRRGCSSWEDCVGSLLLSTRTRP